MKLFGFEIRPERRASAEDPRVPISGASFLEFFGVKAGTLPAVTLDKALTMPAFAAAVTFLPATLANLPLHVFKTRAKGTDKMGGPLQGLLNEAPNPEWTSFGWRKYHWFQVFTNGRGLSYIERNGKEIVGIWPLDATKATITLENGRRFYRFPGKSAAYSGLDIIDTPFLLRDNQLGTHGPLVMLGPAVGLALAMGEYAAGFFGSGGVPPLALTGPLPAGPEAMRRAQADIKRAIEAAKSGNDPVMPIPPGYTLAPVGFDPQKGQMTEARLFQVQEVARVFGLPPVFLQDLSRGTFANVEQQDLYLVKHLVAQWAKAFEDELNLKLFGQGGKVFAEHELDGLMRGDFKTRMDGLSVAIQNALLTPNEGRGLLNRGPLPEGDELLVQGATVPLGSQPSPKSENGGADAQGNPDAQPQA